MMTMVASIDAFSLSALPSERTIFHISHLQGTPSSSLNLVETEVSDSFEDTTILSTPFPAMIHHHLPDEKDESNCARDVEASELSPAFFFPHISMSQQGCVEDDPSLESIGHSAQHPQDGNEKCDADEEYSRDNDEASGEISAVKERDKTERLKQTSMAATLLSKRPQSHGQSGASKGHSKTTSVGARRVGSATKARQNGRSMPRLVHAVRTGTSSKGTPTNDKRAQKAQNPPNSDPSGKLHTAPSKAKVVDGSSSILSSSSAQTQATTVPRAIIESTIHQMLNEAKAKPSIGLLGEPVRIPRVPQRPKPGTILVKARRTPSALGANSATCAVDVRVATPENDLDIANLRLSVFSDFTPQTRKVFCDRSCHLLSARRQRGAICIVVTTHKRLSGDQDLVVGTAEISYHEFSGTRLGQARPEDSILYVTEVAVNSKYRRRGIANIMMEAIEKVAKIRDAETIYLHVDVTNVGALRLYEKAGFEKLPKENHVFKEFTTKLNLHDGATKGRNHYLMSKDLKNPTWLKDIESLHPTCVHEATLGIEVY
jgi:ribosomal protein S18 acetylase RimI-like enzyme